MWSVASSPRGGQPALRRGLRSCRRLFEPLTDPAHFRDRDVVARTFADLYRTQHQEFPPECRDADYEKRLRAAYPIHPEVFDRLYTDWSTLVKFQRTRGVLRLAAVIHSLWEKGDRNPLIQPANIPIDDPRVQSELTRYLSDNWVPILEKDVDGPRHCPYGSTRGAEPRQVRGQPTCGTYHLPGLGSHDDRCQPWPGRPAGEARMRDAGRVACRVRRCATAAGGSSHLPLPGRATLLVLDATTVTKLAEDRAEQLKRDPDKVVHELDQRLRADLRKMGDFNRVHPLPGSSADVPDDLDARLVVLGVEHAYSREPGSAAETAAKAILETRGSTPRLYRNALVPRRR